MKIGVAFSGSGACAAAAHQLAALLQQRSIEITMLSATSLAAVPSLLWSRGVPLEEIDKQMHLFCSVSPQTGLRQLEKAGLLDRPAVCDFAVNCVDVSTGVTVIYSDSLHSNAWNLKVLPLVGNERAALLAALCPWGDAEPVALEGMRLCDFSACYGSPLFPLKMAGMERLMAVSFPGGGTPAQTAANSLVCLTGKNADFYCEVRPEPNRPLSETVCAAAVQSAAEFGEKLRP